VGLKGESDGIVQEQDVDDAQIEVEPMDERAELLRTVIESPDDDAPRLVFADWVEEHGEHERAEFIRFQCRLESLDDNPEETERLRERERELLDEFAWAWAEEFGTELRQWSYRRGLIERVEVNLDTNCSSDME